MIIKNYELKTKFNNYNFFLFHGENLGHKEEIIKNLFFTNFSKNVNSYYQKDILNNFETLYNDVLSLSFFEDKKLIIIKEATDKIKDIILDLKEKELNSIKIILISNILDKKSKLRNLFEKEKNLVSIAFYQDNFQTLSSIATNFFKSKNISISNEIINLLINKANGERKALINELEKIEMLAKTNSNISVDKINKITNITENNNFSELVDNCLAKKNKKISQILNQNILLKEDTVLIIRVLLSKAKRLLNLVKNYKLNNNLEKTISEFKPPIFWKDKEITKEQIKNWSITDIERLIFETVNTELLIKKNNENSLNILVDFLLSKSKINN